MIGLADPLALLWLAILLPVLFATSYATRRRREADAAFGGGTALRRGRVEWRRPLQQLLLLAAIVLVVIAVARPQWGEEERPLTRLGIDMAIALDVSRSMTASDIAPSRADAAAGSLDQLFNHLRGDRVGLVTFAGDAFERSPLTLDLDAVRQLVARAQEEQAFVRPGTDLGGALEAALRLLDIEDPAETQVIVLISDGEDLAEDLGDALEEAEDAGVRVFTVAAGTPDGGTMAARESGDEGAPTVRRPAGDELSRADRPTLQRIADATGGDLRELGELPGLAVEFQRLRQSAFDQGANRAPVERFQWFLGGALLLLVLQALAADGSWQRRLGVGRLTLAASTLPAIALIVACASAEYAATEDGHDAYAAGRYDDALASYRDAEAVAPEAPEPPYNIGNTLHQLGRYEEATVASSTAMSAALDPLLFTRAAYALGSHAFRRNDLEAARDAWISVLLRDPSDLDAKHNLELTLSLLAGPEETPAPTPPAGGGDGEGQGEGEGGTGDEEPPPDDASPDQSGEGGGQPQPGPTPGATPERNGAGDSPPPSDPADSGGSPAGGPGAQVEQEQPPTLDDARALLAEEALRIGDEALTIEDAIALLELVRRTSELEALAPRGVAGGPGDR